MSAEQLELNIEEQEERAKSLAMRILSDPSPCDLCWFKACCRDMEMACEQYAGWARFYLKRSKHWSRMNKYPRRDIYEMVFSREDKVLTPGARL